MAPGWVPTLLDLEESETSARSAGCCLRGAGADPGHVPSQSAVGSASRARRAHELGISISQAAVSMYMIRHRKPPSQTWRSFLDNHVKDLVSVDLFTLPTATFRVLFVFIVLRHDRRRIAHFNVADHPSAEWTAQQIVDAFPWESAPRFMLRDRDGVYGPYFSRRVAGLGVDEVRTAPRSPWQNSYFEGDW